MRYMIVAVIPKAGLGYYEGKKKMRHEYKEHVFSSSREDAKRYAFKKAKEMKELLDAENKTKVPLCIIPETMEEKN